MASKISASEVRKGQAAQAHQNVSSDSSQSTISAESALKGVPVADDNNQSANAAPAAAQGGVVSQAAFDPMAYMQQPEQPVQQQAPQTINADTQPANGGVVSTAAFDPAAVLNTDTAPVAQDAAPKAAQNGAVSTISFNPLAYSANTALAAQDASEESQNKKKDIQDVNALKAHPSARQGEAPARPIDFADAFGVLSARPAERVEESSPATPPAAADQKQNTKEKAENIAQTQSEVADVTPVTDIPFVTLKPAIQRENRVEMLDTSSLKNVEKMSDETFSKAAEQNKNRIQENIKHKVADGNTVSGKIYGDPNVSMTDIAIGERELQAMLEQPGCQLIPKINEVLAKGATGLQLKEDAPWQQVASILNKVVNFDVSTQKPPINESASKERRTLRVHGGRGVSMHPTQAKFYNGDFDGDEIVCQLMLNFAKQPEYFMLGIDGNAMFDPDFFPHPSIPGKTEKEQLAALKKLLPKGLRDAHATAILRFCNGMTKDSKGAMTRLVNDILNGTSSPRKALQTMNKIYDALHEVTMYYLTPAMDKSDYKAPEPIEPGDGVIRTVLEEMRVGKPPMNFQDFKVIMHAPLTEDNGKNVAFRVGANYLKMLKMNPNIKIGSSDYFAQLYEKTIEMGTSLSASGYASIEDKVLYAGNMLKTTVFKEVGMPDSYQTFSAFLIAFRDSYARHSQAMQMANIELLTNMTIRKGSNPILVVDQEASVMELVPALVNVYGKLTYERMFSHLTKFAKDPKNQNRMEAKSFEAMNVMLRDKSLKEISRNNKLVITMDMRKAAEKIKYSANGDALHDRRLLNAVTVALIDMRSSKESKYNKVFMGTNNKKGLFQNIYETLQGVKKLVGENNDPKNPLSSINPDDLAKYAERYLELVHDVAPEIFAEYKMTGATSFVHSEFGRLLLNAKNVGEIGGIYMTMLYKSRMQRLERVRSEYVNELNSTEENNTEKIDALYTQLQLEEEALASSSYAWNAIVRERYSNEAWGDLTSENKLKPLKFTNYPKDKWAKLNEYYGSLQEVMEDPMAPKSFKEAVLSDVARWYENATTINGYGMLYQLSQDSAAIYRGGVLATSDETTDSIAELEARNDRFTNFVRRSIKESIKQINDAYNTWHETEGALTSYINELATDPLFLHDIPNDLIGDAMSSVLDKVFKVSEKGGQTYATDGLYNGLSYAINGGLIDQVFYTDNRSLGVIGASQLTIKDLVSALNGKTLYVYEEGYLPKEVSLRTLLEKEDYDEEDIWGFLRANPSLAMALRPTSIRISAGRKPVNYQAATMSISAGIMHTTQRGEDGLPSRYYSKARLAMMQHPSFYGMVAFLTPTRGRTSRTVSQDYSRNFLWLLDQFITITQYNIEAEMHGRGLDTNILYSKLFPSVDKMIAWGVDDQEAINTKALVTEKMNNYIHELTDIYRGHQGFIKQDIQGIDRAPGGSDISSMAAFYDVRQEFNGAKTKTSTEIEGSETWKYGVWGALLQPTDKYVTIDLETPTSILYAAQGKMTNLGHPFNLDELSAMLIEATQEGGPGELVVRTDSYGTDQATDIPDIIAQDPTSDYSSKEQMPSLLRWQMIKRDRGAEAFNLKVKKMGDDGTDLIVKFNRNDSRNFRKLEQYLQKTNQDQGRIVAVSTLAQLIRQADKEIGYEELTLANYMSIAEYLLPETENGNVSLQSIEMLYAGIKKNICKNWDAISRGDIDKLNEIAQNTKLQVSNAKPADLLRHVKPLSKTNTASAPTVRVYSSGFHRNYHLLDKLSQRYQYAGKNAVYKIPPAGFPSSIKFPGYNMRGELTSEETQQPAFMSYGPTELYFYHRSASKELMKDMAARGVTVAVRMEDVSYLPGKLADALVHYDGNVFILPFFDMQLNGSEAKPHYGSVATWWCDDDRLVTTYEDPDNVDKLGDSDAQPFDAFVDRIDVNRSYPRSLSVEDLFPVTLANQDINLMQMETLSDPEIIAQLINNQGDYTIDYGNANLSEVQERMDKRIAKYVARHGETDENGWLPDAGPDEIIGWVKLRYTINGQRGMHQVIAPVIPFPWGIKNSYPSHYTIDHYDIGSSIGANTSGVFINDKNALNLVMKYDGDIVNDGDMFKFHEAPGGAANKMEVPISKSKPGPSLESGVPIDLAYAEATTGSRRDHILRRMKTLYTMVNNARREPYGYNIAQDCENAFPDSPEFKELLMHDSLPGSFWSELLDEGIRLHTDPAIDAYMRETVQTCLAVNMNPSVFFCSHYDGMPTKAWSEWEAVFSYQLSHEDAMLRLFHEMMPSLVPNGLDGDDSATLFKLSKDCPGALMVKIKRETSAGMREQLVYAYTGWSFFGEDFSGFTQPGIKGSSITMDAIIAMALHHRMPTKRNLTKMVKWAASDTPSYNAISKVTMEDVEKTEEDSGEEQGELQSEKSEE